MFIIPKSISPFECPLTLGLLNSEIFKLAINGPAFVIHLIVSINKTSLENEIKYLIVYKKALYNADTIEENDLLLILKPLINSESIWKSHGLYLLAEYFFSKNEKQKAKDFFSQIIMLENANQEILKESQKRLNRDLSD